MNASCQKLTLCSLGAGLLLLGLPGIAAPAEGATPLIDKVHSATARYIDINVAIAEGFVRATPCVSGPNAGAMGVHLVLPARISSGALNPEQPQALFACVLERLPRVRFFHVVLLEPPVAVVHVDPAPRAIGGIGSAAVPDGARIS